MMPSALAALKGESERLSGILDGLGEDDWRAPTRCAPWDAAALTAHIAMTLARLHPMLDAPEPPAATVDAAGYYRPDARFSPLANATRVDTATAAAADGGPVLAARFRSTWRTAAARCATEPPTRRVTTRHGDPMALHDFLTTRVVELAVHGIDLADALGRPRWTTPEAAARTAALLLGPRHDTALADLGLDAVAFIAKATGRDPFTPDERAHAERLGTTWLALG